MSFDAVSWAWNQKTGNKPGRKWTLVAVAQFADEDGYCWPGQKMLAEYTEQSPRTIRNHLTWLEENGYLTRKSRLRPDGTHTSDAYYLNLDKAPADFNTKRKKTAADYAASESPKNRRQNLPLADSADGKKQHDPAAKFATHESVIDNPKGLSEPVKAARGTRLPKDWTLKAEWLDWTLRETARLADELVEWKGGAWSEQHTSFEAEKFRDYWCGKSGKDAAKTDWPATWRNWVRNAGPMKAAKSGGGGKWWLSQETKLAKAIEVGVGPAHAGEPDNAWEARIQAAIDNGGKPPEQRKGPTVRVSMPAEANAPRTGPTDASVTHVGAALALLKKRPAALSHDHASPNQAHTGAQL